MKILLVFAAVVATTYSANYTQELLTKEYATNISTQLKKCKDQFPSISNEDYKKLSNHEKVSITKDIECFALCYAKGRGYYKGPGKMDIAKLKAGNSQKYKNPTNLKGANKIDRTCVKRVQKETNDCTTAAKFFLCRGRQGNAMGFKFAMYRPS